MRSFARMLILRPGLRFLGLEQRVGLTRLWNLPGGKVEMKESPRAAAIREVFEETGLLCNSRFVQPLCQRELLLGQSTWIGHFFVYSGPLFVLQIREPDKILNLRWLEIHEARSLRAHQEVFADIYEFALGRLRIEYDPWIKQQCVERSNSSKRRTLEKKSIFAS